MQIPCELGPSSSLSKIGVIFEAKKTRLTKDEPSLLETNVIFKISNKRWCQAKFSSNIRILQIDVSAKSVVSNWR